MNENASINFITGDKKNLRDRFMVSKEITYFQYNMALADIIGKKYLQRLMPAKIEELREAYKEDEHLNNIPLRLWDSRDWFVRSAAHNAGIKCWSLSDSVSFLKCVAKDLIGES